MSTGAYESDGAALQRALVWLSFVAAASDHVRWTLRGNSDDVAQIGFSAVASAARRGCEAVADALRASGVPPDARPSTLSSTLSLRYLRSGWISPHEALADARGYLSGVRSWITQDRDALVEQEHDGRTVEALDRAIVCMGEAIEALPATRPY